MPPIVGMRGVSKSYPGAATPVLQDVDLTVEPGEKVSLIGPSGSGKSTLLGLIAGLLRPDQGVIEINGVPTEILDDAGRARIRGERVGIALQFDNLVPFLTAGENVRLALSFGDHTSRSERTSRAMDLLDLLGVSDRVDHLPRQLSGGEAQRVALAVAMANKPDILLADEVVAQLDAGTAGAVIEYVLAAEFAVLYVSHDRALADEADTHYELRDLGVHRR